MCPEFLVVTSGRDGLVEAYFSLAFILPLYFKVFFSLPFEVTLDLEKLQKIVQSSLMSFSQLSLCRVLHNDRTLSERRN